MKLFLLHKNKDENMNTKYVIASIIAIIIIIGSVAAYVYLSTPASNTPQVSLNGAGATFPQPFLDATITAYSSMKPNVQINYQGVGSGSGINSLLTSKVDFAASDAPLNSNQTSFLPATALHIPETIGAVTVTYNLPGISSGLKLSGDLLAQIYLGTVTNWNDPAIVALNSDITLPDHAITTVHRSDSSGTTNVFTKYLSAVSSTWKDDIGSGTSVQWPGTNALGASGNANVAATVIQTEYSIGYVELAYALQNHMAVASIQNPAGNFIEPTLESTTAAVESGASDLPAGDQSWSSVSLLNTSGEDAYPIVTFTYLLSYRELNVIPGMTQDKATALVQYMWYVVHDGQHLAADLEYAALPSNVIAINEATIQSITFDGQTLPVS
jgi:phosphate transport system substrate-binding protein